MPKLLRRFVCSVVAVVWALVSAPGVADTAAVPAPSSADEVVIDYGEVGYAHIEGPIDRLRHRYLLRMLEQARADGLDTVIVHIDTDGGEVSVARDMFRAVLEQSRDGPRMVAYVDYRAISAGALITYAHEAVYVAPTASIGDIGVIFQKTDGEIAYAPEKIETVIRTLLVQAAEQRGWNRALLLKMTARNQKLYRIARPASNTAGPAATNAEEYVIEDDLPAYLAAHPDVDMKNERQVVLYRGEDRLLTLTGNEALALGMATGEAATVGALYAKLGVAPETVVDLSPTRAELAASWLSGFGPILAGLALLFVLFELKTPGVGIWAGLGLACGALFLMTHFALDLINNVELLLIIVGAALLFFELVTVAGGGILGVIGASTLFAGLLLGFLPDEIPIEPSDVDFQDAIVRALLNVIYTVGVLTAGFVAFIAIVPRSPIASRMALAKELTGTSGGELARSASEWVGRTGETETMLRPGGTVQVDGVSVSARAVHGNQIGKGIRVRVIRIEFGELVVEPDADAENSPEGALT